MQDDQLYKKNIKRLLNATTAGDSQLGSMPGASINIVADATVKSLPAPPSGALYAFLFVTTADIVYTTDGSTPTTADPIHGIALGANQTQTFSVTDIAAIKFTRKASTNANIYVDYKKNYAV